MKKEQLITIVVVLVLIISAIYLIKYFKYDAENEKISTNTSNEIYCNNDLDFFRMRYNHFRPHASLDGKTPAEIYFS